MKYTSSIKSTVKSFLIKFNETIENGEQIYIFIDGGKLQMTQENDKNVAKKRKNFYKIYFFNKLNESHKLQLGNYPI